MVLKVPNSEARNGKQYDIRSFKVAKFSKGCAGNEIQRGRLCLPITIISVQ